MPTPLDSLDRRPLYAQVAQGIAAMIKDTGLMPGDDLPSEAELCERASVSRVVVRGALAQLAGAGLIKISNGRRAQVMSLDANVLTASLSQGLATAQFSVVHALEVRNAIEASTAALAAQNRSDADCARLEALCDQMQAVMDEVDRFAELDYQFHFVVAEATGNPLYTYIVQSLRDVIKSSVSAGRLAQPTLQDQHRILADHRRIQQAIANGDPAAATIAMQDHFTSANTALLQGTASQTTGT